MELLFRKHILCGVEFCSTIYCCGNNNAMATEKYLSDYVTRWATLLF